MHNFFFQFRRFLLKYKSNIYQISIAYLSGRFINEFYGDKAIKNIKQFWCEFFALDNNLFNLLTWIVIIVPLLCLFLLFLLNKWFDRNNDAVLIQEIKANVIDKDIFPFKSNHIAWGTCLTIQKAPDMDKGWPVDEIRINNNVLNYAIKDKHGYRAFCDENENKLRLFDDRTKYMLSKNPVSFVDSPTLLLDLKRCKYSEVLFYKHLIEHNPGIKTELIEQMQSDLLINFPGSLCLHLIVVTQDDKILITKRSPKVVYYPNCWSVSVEEQFDERDTDNDFSKGVLNLLCRAMLEELALSTDYYSTNNAKILSVFLESDIMNISLCGLVHVDIKSTHLDNLLSSKVSKDNEFTEWKFLSWDELIEELDPTKVDRHQYHPTGKYRILMALIYRFGIWRITKKINNW